MRLVNISEGWLQRVSVCVRVSDGEILSKPVNEMRRTPHHTHTRTLHLFHPPPLRGSRSPAIWRIGQESRLCVFTWNLSCGNSSPVFLFHFHHSLSVFLLTLSVCYLQFQFSTLHIIFPLQMGTVRLNINMTKINIYFESSSLIAVAVYV